MTILFQISLIMLITEEEKQQLVERSDSIRSNLQWQQQSRQLIFDTVTVQGKQAMIILQEGPSETWVFYATRFFARHGVPAVYSIP